MAHEVYLKVPKLDVQRADVEFEVSDDEGKIGTLRVSKGSVVWVPKGKHSGGRIRWRNFDVLMQNNYDELE
ncbi:hypothetical protein [Paucidesulfovibrio gracilis]|uniref:hypothetical protein n=1 Tax=Paucidesulfovibrio gracilis TaxID=47158 RepID=UPI00099A79F4|nr:hypothetical protein [Paucidesulfovibrio gracilis]